MVQATPSPGITLHRDANGLRDSKEGESPVPEVGETIGVIR